MKKVNTITILNIISSFLLQGIAFLSTPIFTRILGTSQYGQYSLFNSWVLILTCIMGASMYSSISTGRFVFKNEYLSFRNSILVYSTFICVFEILIFCILGEILKDSLHLSNYLIILICVCAFAHYIINFAQTSFIYEKKALNNLVLSVTTSLMSVLLSIFLILKIYNDNRLFGRIYGVVIVYTIVAIFSWIFLYSEKPTKLKKEYLIYGFNVGFPIVFHTLSQQVLGQSDRVMMELFGISSSEIGIYSLFYTLTAVLSTLLGALNNSWCPFYYDDLNDEKWDLLQKKSKNYIELFTVLSIGFLLLSREVTYAMSDNSYWDGISIIPILAIAVYFTFMYIFPVNFEFYHKKTKIIAIGTVGAGILNIILNAIMIPMWGMYGAAIATALSYLALFFTHFFIVIHMKEHPYHLKMKVFIPGVIGMIVGSALFYALSPWWYVRWGLGIALGCLELYRIYKRKSIF